MNKQQILVDSEGHFYRSISEASRILKASKPNIIKSLQRKGEARTIDGLILRRATEEEARRALQTGIERDREEQQKSLPGFGLYDTTGGKQRAQTKPRKQTPEERSEQRLFEELKTRYSLNELREIAKGQGIENREIEYPEIHLTGEHHRLLVMSDTHIGSIYAPEEWHKIVSEFATAKQVEAILHCGDLVDGLKIARAGTQIYELNAIGYDAQLKKAVELFRQYSQPVYIISGNHDRFFTEYAGANIVKAFADELPNVQYVGHDSADIEIGGAVVRLFHGGDGSSYATSYRLQKLVEAINGGHKPDILLCGHVHKFCYILERNIHAVSVPAMQAQTAFMRGKKLPAHTGFLLLDFDTIRGKVKNFGVTYYPFYA